MRSHLEDGRKQAKPLELPELDAGGPAGKPTNPKDAIASDKVPLELAPDTLKVAAAMAFVEGALKYGKMNWRVCGARASVYLGALERHMTCWKNGEEIDADSGLPHLWKAAACIAILIDCRAAGTLIDDRPPSVDIGEMLRGAEGVVKNLRAAHASRDPYHYTIKDKVVPL